VPSMVLLDLKLPRLDGLAVLQAIRENATTRYLPVIMMTSSDDDRDRLAAYDRHVNSYIKKPINYDEFVAAARQLGLYWIVLNLPAPV
jgi:two-component system response regulator